MLVALTFKTPEELLFDIYLLKSFQARFRFCIVNAFIIVSAVPCQTKKAHLKHLRACFQGFDVHFLIDSYYQKNFFFNAQL